MIKIQNLTKKYGDLVAVNDISFEVATGEVLGFLGPNGAGKTTTMRIITGYIPPSHGTVTVGDFDVVEEPLSAKRLIGYLPESPPLYTEMTVSGYLDFVADIKGLEKSKKAQSIDYVLDRCGLGDVRSRIIGNLSKGYKQRVGLAQAIVNDPSLLILDEPTVGLDPKQIIEIRELIKNLAGERTVILSTHILQEVAMTCTRVVIINRGGIVLEESMEDLSRSTDTPATVLLKLGQGGSHVTEALRGVSGVESVTEEETGIYIINAREGIDVRGGISKTVVDKGWPLLELRSMEETLEDVFLRAISTEGE